MVTVYARPEDEFYHKHCSWSYTFPVSGKVAQKDELQPLRLAMLLTPDQAAAARCVSPCTASSQHCMLCISRSKAGQRRDNRLMLHFLDAGDRKELNAVVGNVAMGLNAAA